MEPQACTWADCPRRAFNRMGVRLRVMADGGEKPTTNAIFSRETTIWLCDKHSAEVTEVVVVAVLDGKGIIKGTAVI